MIKSLAPVAPPTKGELFTLRLMIVFGTSGMLCLLYFLYRESQVGYAPFYWVLMAGITFNCLRVLHEWYHYIAIRIPPTPPVQRPFTVDIFTTYCPGEPYTMVEKTLAAIQAIRYPHTAWLCDEANDPYLIEVCKKLGVKHVTRSNRKDAKAGNINNALQYATGELCVILDPDHVPAPDFLDYVVHHFNDAKVGFVQIVQAYHNMGDSLVAKGAAQQTFQFYGPIMATMNSYGTVLAIGANCTFRRAALDDIGGHAAGLAEDMHTAMQLHAKKWTSVYVPAVLTRGLVPSTMSAYFAQQLKWARGTFELLVTSYPRLFRHFTWRQRLHYFTAPLHYFSGVVFLINFLIPVLSLLTGLIPFRADILDFTLLGLPVLAAVVLIRHYVQRWVMEETERGFHVVGGLLFIGTWWVHILGLVYTLVRKKVPYIPTPKDDGGPDHWAINLPNIFVLAVSAFAIVYGLWYDWNPYSLMMAGIAGVNCLIMLFNIIASLRFNRLPKQMGWVRPVLIYPLLVKKQFWKFRHLHLYVVFRKLALPIVFTSVCFTLYIFSKKQAPLIFTNRHAGVTDTSFYTGMFSPATAGGLSSMSAIRQYQQSYNTGTAIVSLYIPWGDAPQCLLPEELVRDIYQNGSLPMITWEPWAALFREAPAREEQKILSRVATGALDPYLLRFAAQIKALDRPVFLRFAHEPDNPAYPWSPAGGNTPDDFKAAWRYVHAFFARRNVNNVIWVWNPWRPESAENYFPGNGYVDWLAVTALNYGPHSADGRSYSFSQLYNPYHRLRVFRSGLPVMAAEMGSLAAAGGQTGWFNNAFRDIRGAFPEIRACVFFNSNIDNNLPGGRKDSVLNWKLQDPAAVFAAQKTYFGLGGKPRIARLYDTIPIPFPQPTRQLPDSIRGIGYQKGNDWFRNLHTVTRREIARDFAGMKAAGINTIKRAGPGIYDRNILIEAAAHGMAVHYSFWLPDITGMQQGGDALTKLEENILQTVNRLKHDPQIRSWNIANNAWQQLAGAYHKPALLYEQKAIMDWLRRLTNNIRAADSLRPLTVDVYAADNLPTALPYLRQQLPAADAFGLVYAADAATMQNPDAASVPWFISRAPVGDSLAVPGRRVPAFIAAWQDLATRNYVSFDGLLDHEGRFKPDYYKLPANKNAPQLPEISILKPSRSTNPNTLLSYHALVSSGGEWKLAENAGSRLKFEWRLLQTDRFGNGVSLQYLGTGPSVTVSIPERPMYYRLYLTAVQHNNVRTAVSTLNTPLADH